MTPARWDWDEERGPARLEAELAGAGIAWIRAPELVEAAAREPWSAAERLMGERPLLLERQPIRAVPGGRSFACGTMAAPFHTDSQTLLGVPPHVQVMACACPAERGGESLYLDTWGLLARVEREDPALFADVFEVPRCFPFVFGDFSGPTAALRGGSLVFTHTARPRADDAVAVRLRTFVESEAPIEIRAEKGDLVLIHNHRMLHGRRAFDDVRRSFTRLLVWRRRPWPAPPRWLERAEPGAVDVAGRGAALAMGESDGRIEDASAQVRRRLGVVLELLRGVPPGILSAREGVPEAELYRWRDAALRGAAAGLDQASRRPE